MKTSKAARKPISEIEVYRNFMRLDATLPRRVAVRILRNQKVLADLYDHLLIHRSLDEPGENVAWESHKQANGSKP